MLRCTYIVTIYNQEKNIPFLIESLSKIVGIFRKEFIFIDDGSSDDSLNILKRHLKSLTNVTIISNPHLGPTNTLSTVKNLISNDYIHFIDGNTIISPIATKAMIEASVASKTKLSISSITKDNKKIFNKNYKSISELNPESIENPIKKILLGTNPHLLSVGNSNSVIHLDLLLQLINKIDANSYFHNISLSLLSAQYSKFTYLPLNLTQITSDNYYYTNDFLVYNELLTTYNFVTANTNLFENLAPELLQFLYKRKKENHFYNKLFLMLKKFQKSSVNEVLNLYSQEINYLLQKFSCTT